MLLTQLPPGLLTNISVKHLLHIRSEGLFVRRLIKNCQRILFYHRHYELLFFSAILENLANGSDHFSEVNIFDCPAESVLKIGFTKEGIDGGLELLTVRIAVFRADFFYLRKRLLVQQAVFLALLRLLFDILKYVVRFPL